MQAGCQWAADSEFLPVRPAISFSSLFGSPRPARPHRAWEIEEEDSSINTNERIEELSTWMTDIAVEQSELCSELVRRHDATQQFQGWMVSAIRGIASHSGMDPSALTP